MEISKIGGLPAHPLVVHLAIMGIPLSALLIALYVVQPRWRDGLRVAAALMVALTAVGTVMAAGSGEKLEDMLPRVDRASALVHQHTELGEQTEWIVVAFGIVALAYLALDWYRSRAANRVRGVDRPAAAGSLKTALTALGVVAVVLGGVATVWDVRTGHAGAKATWHDAISEEPTGSAAKDATTR